MINVGKRLEVRKQETLEIFRKLLNWEFHDLYSSFYVAEVIKPLPPSTKNKLGKIRSTHGE
jgi:hypothetical protein